MNVARSGHTATLLTEPGCAPHCGKVLVVGGAVTQDPTAAGLEVTDSEELYDPATKTWSATSSVPGARAFHTASRDFVRGGHAAAWCGKVLVAGGEQAGTTTEVPRPPTSVIHRAEHTATLMPDGRVLVVGGLNEFDQPRFSAEIYDPATPDDPWPTNPLTPAMTNGRASHPLPRPQRAGRRRRRPRPGLESHGALHALALAWKPDARR